MSFSLELFRSFCQTNYWVETPGESFRLRIGEFHHALATFLAAENIDTWAILTAENPRSQQLSEEENQSRREQLAAKAEQLGHPHFPTRALAPAGDWPAEVGFLLGDLSLAEAVALGRHFDQHAVVYGNLTQPPGLLFCFSEEVRPTLVRALTTDLHPIANQSLQWL